MVEVDNSSVSPAASGESKPQAAKSEKKRNLPGMPDPDAEVIALSPEALLATNRFVCEICNKGFQRDQNLQLHRRGHNLPWKLRQRTSKDVRKRVYVCPEPTCVHHDPSRALGDLTGIKKHFSRKHGEKKHRCDRCSKKYAVLSDLKAHVKTCGTREYRCDCGTLFSRRDSFITHRAFCDALAQETARSQPPAAMADPAGDLNVQVMGPPLPAVGSPSPSPAPVSRSPPQPLTPSTDVLSPVLSVQSSAAELPENHNARFQASAVLLASSAVAAAASSSSSTTSGGAVADQRGPYSIFGSSASELSQTSHPLPSYSSMLWPTGAPGRPISDPVSLTLSPSLYGGALPSFSGALQNPRSHYFQISPSPALSATALLQKAAQIGSTSSNSSILHGPSEQPAPSPALLDTHAPFRSSFSQSMLRHSAVFSDKPDTSSATLDFLGLGMGSGGGFLNSLSSCETFPNMCSGLDAWDDPSERKPSML